MTARNRPPPGWVTLAAAAAALTEAGDAITAPNVSRYLDRNPEVPQQKGAKFRFVDLAALRAHRSSSVLVAEKREARDLGDLEPSRTAFASSRIAETDEDKPDRPGSPMAEAKLEAQLLDLRRKRREEAIEDGRYVPAEDLQTVVAGVLAAFTAELARQETALTAKFGADIGVAVRKAHREARAKAAERLRAAASEVLHPNAAAQLVGAPAADAEAA